MGILCFICFGCEEDRSPSTTYCYKSRTKFVCADRWRHPGNRSVMDVGAGSVPLCAGPRRRLPTNDRRHSIRQVDRRPNLLSAQASRRLQLFAELFKRSRIGTAVRGGREAHTTTEVPPAPLRVRPPPRTLPSPVQLPPRPPPIVAHRPVMSVGSRNLESACNVSRVYPPIHGGPPS